MRGCRGRGYLIPCVQAREAATWGTQAGYGWGCPCLAFWPPQSQTWTTPPGTGGGQGSGLWQRERQEGRSQGQDPGGRQGQGVPQTPRWLGPGVECGAGGQPSQGLAAEPPRGKEGWGRGQGQAGLPSPCAIWVLGFAARRERRPGCPPRPRSRAQGRADAHRTGLPEARPWALGLLGILRAAALQVAQVDGLEGCAGAAWSVGAQEAAPARSCSYGSPGTHPPHQLLHQETVRVGFPDPPLTLQAGEGPSPGPAPCHPPRGPCPLTLQAGVRDLLHILLHQAPLAARDLAPQVPLHALPG